MTDKLTRCLSPVAALALLLSVGCQRSGNTELTTTADDNPRAVSYNPEDDPEAGRLEAELAGEVDAILAAWADSNPEATKPPTEALEQRWRDIAWPARDLRRWALSRALLTQAADSEQPLMIRLWLLRQEARLAGDEAVRPLARLLRDDEPKIRENARRALQAAHAPEATAILVAEFDQTDDPAWQVALLNALGQRDEDTAYAALERAAYASNDAVATAALSALGELGGRRAQRTAARILAKSEGARRAAAASALLRIADRLLAGGARNPAAESYEALYETPPDRAMRTAALRGLAQAMDADALPTLLEELEAEPADAVPPAIVRALIADIPEREVTVTLVRRTTDATGEELVNLIRILAMRSDRTAQPRLIELSRTDHGAVALAAVEALGQVGDAAAVDALLTASVADSYDLQQAAREALVDLPGREVDDELVRALKQTSKPAVRDVAARLLLARNYQPAADAILTTLQAPETERPAALFEALGGLGTAEQLPQIVHSALNAETDRATAAGLAAAVQVARRTSSEPSASELLVAALADPQLDARPQVVTMLGQLANLKALVALRGVMDDDDPEVVAAAVRALSNWPRAGVVDDLLAIAATSEVATHRVLALRGVARLLRTPSAEAWTAEQRLDKWREAAALAEREDTRKRLLAALGTVDCTAALHTAREYLDDQALQNEAALAIAAIARQHAYRDHRAAEGALNAALAQDLDPRVAGQIQTTQQMITAFAGYLTAWQFTGPLQRENADAKDLHALVLPPEKSPSQVEWRPLTTRAAENPWIYDLTQLETNANCCIYARTVVDSSGERPATLLIGSDDGIKVWLNGDLVHDHFAVRPVTPGEDRAEVTLRPGRNDLMIKVVQGVGGWGFCVGVRDRDGDPLPSVKEILSPMAAERSEAK